MDTATYTLPASQFPLAECVATAVALHRGDTILFANGALARLTGYSEAELARMPFARLFPGHAQDCVEALARTAARDAPPSHRETCLVTRAGETRWVELTIARTDIDGQRTAVCSLVDITDRKLAEAAQQQAKQLLAQIIDGDPVPTLVIDASHAVTHWNRACEQILGLPAAAMVGTRRQWEAFYDSERPILADLIVSGTVDEIIGLYGGKNLRRSQVIAGAYEAEDFFPRVGGCGRWLYFTAAPLYNADGAMIGAIETLQDITERKNAENALLQMRADLEATVVQRTRDLQDAKASLEEDIARREMAETELLKRYVELTDLNCRLHDTQQQLVQSEKMASIGQLAAGVAHEINNPIGYVNSNLHSLKTYIGQLLEVLDTYEAHRSALPPADADAIESVKRAVDFAYLRDDIGELISESAEGTARVRKIVQDLRDFSRTDASQDWQAADLHQGLDSTLNIASNEIKYKADVVREYGTLPLVECLPSQLNQVFMNLFVNAAQAMPDNRRGTICVRTGHDGDTVWIEIADDGSGIPPDVLDRIFDPFFTTKPVGKGTGLGLSLSYGIVQKHHGHIAASSAPGTGTCFRITLPVHHQAVPGVSP
ncbi:ATP-binding protein [Zoogloea sp.]|uniref:ATP-binding protein n=1 Tax=Zoogloea sp. TaxID=49181 RepID=UPI0035B24E32